MKRPIAVVLIAASLAAGSLALQRTPAHATTESVVVPAKYRWVAALVKTYFSPMGTATYRKAMCVASLESGFNPNARNSSGAEGVYQFMPRTWSYYSHLAGWGGASAYWAKANVATAAWVVRHHGWSAWSTGWRC